MRRLDFGKLILVVLLIFGYSTIQARKVVSDNEYFTIEYTDFGTYYQDSIEYQSSEIIYNAKKRDLLLDFPNPNELKSGIPEKREWDLLNFIYEDVSWDDYVVKHHPCREGFFIKYLEKDHPFRINVLHPSNRDTESIIQCFRLRPGQSSMKEFENYKITSYPGDNIIIAF